jgi:SPP1 gp7 family putative phage head morphogenesis protein
MAWPVTSDPERFDEALRFFQTRVVMTADFAIGLDAKARAEAFWIGTGLQVQEIQSVFNEIQKSIDAGEPFEDFQKRVKDKLGNKAHAETVFRNATQRSYNAGRWAQMRDPDVLAARPYFMFDAILDSSTTPTCRDANGTVLPAEHPWWERNVPPRHHRCRSGIRSLRARDAERRGISTDGPTEATDGFGAAPSEADIGKLQPGPDTDVRLIDLTRKKANKTRKKKKLPPAPPPGVARKRKPKKKPELKPAPLQKPTRHYDPDHWEQHYQAQYGASATAVGWGRAMYERALDRPFGELADQAQKLADAGHPLFSQGPLRAERLQQFAAQLGRDTTLRGSALIAQAPEHYTSALAQIEHSLSIKAGKFPIEAINEQARQAKAFYETMLHESVIRPTGYTMQVGTYVRPSGIVETVARSYHSGTEKLIALTETSKPSIYVHEWAHAIEATDARALARSVRFHEARTLGEAEKILAEMFPGKGYGDNETAKPDKYWTAYQGKVYRGRMEQVSNTEMTAIGYQALSDPLEFGKQDAETTWFMLGQLAGR